jgi:hypothetical protein
MSDILKELRDALQLASDHLDYCGYGDSWERECAKEQKLDEQIAAALALPELTMIDHLKRAVELGYSITCPGLKAEVREAFPDVFASQAEVAATDVWDDDLEADDYPMVSRGDGGYWLSCWTWVQQDEEDGS